MMKMSRKSLLVIGLLVCLAGGLVAYGAFTISSNVLHVTVLYTVNLNGSLSADIEHLTAHLESRGSPVNGATIDFFESPDGITWVGIGTNITNLGGNAIFDYTITDNGEYYFLAQYTVQ